MLPDLGGALFDTAGKAKMERKSFARFSTGPLTGRLLPLQQLDHRLAHRFSDVHVSFRVAAVVSA